MQQEHTLSNDVVRQTIWSSYLTCEDFVVISLCDVFAILRGRPGVFKQLPKFVRLFQSTAEPHLPCLHICLDLLSAAHMPSAECI